MSDRPSDETIALLNASMVAVCIAAEAWRDYIDPRFEPLLSPRAAMVRDAVDAMRAARSKP
jgi:hypothetical protein